MPGRYTWIKLYSEILHDPKMGRLSDSVWRRAVEIFLLAGENGRDGLLQPIADMAWELHSSVADVTASLQLLEETGVVREVEPGQWLVVNFQKRQAAMSDRERQQKHRSGASRGSNEDDTPLSRTGHEIVTEGEGEVEEELKTPPTPRAAKKSERPVPVPSFTEGWQAISERIYQHVAQQPTLPATDKRDAALIVLWKYFENTGSENAAITALTPYFRAWCDKYPASRGNMAWLTEWAVSGQIPQKKDKRPVVNPDEQARLKQLAAQKLMAGVNQ
jgi:hypothetical protein